MAKVAPKPINSTKRKMRIRDFLTLFKGSVGDVARRSLMRYSIFSVTPDVNNASVPMYHCIQLALAQVFARLTKSPPRTPLGMRPRTCSNGFVIKTRPECKSEPEFHKTSLHLQKQPWARLEILCSTTAIGISRLPLFASLSNLRFFTTSLKLLFIFFPF